MVHHQLIRDDAIEREYRRSKPQIARQDANLVIVMPSWAVGRAKNGAGVTPSGLMLWISREHRAARLAGTQWNTENAAMYEIIEQRSGLRGNRNSSPAISRSARR
ncbi:MAG: hypothetical protein JO283_22105 [Bradyrhizobium sp.]|nr:hypothetical protein [Bradyrhizobium sp.]